MCYLSQYGIRSKQDYIFRSNVMVEMSGASELITTVFDLLVKCASEAGLRIDDCEIPFQLDDVLKKFQSGELQAAELFRGGGNSLILFDSEESFRVLNAAFTHTLACKRPGMIPLCVGIPVGENGIWDYKEDYKKLSDAINKEKSRMTIENAIPITPFSEIDRKTGQPIVCACKEAHRQLYLTAEAMAKRSKGSKRKETLDLEKMAQQKGEESLLAVIHADGNNMGIKVKNELETAKDYTECINRMRSFTRKTAEVFSVKGRKAVDDTGKKVRWLLCDGDDATFVCNARHAKELVSVYLKTVSAENGYSSCAGICIFHCRYPFHMAYRIAESCCDSAKKKIHQSGSGKDESWIDFHYLHSGMDGSLDELRERSLTKEAMLRPLGIGTETVDSIEKLDKLALAFKETGITRTNIKSLGNEWEYSREEGKNELHRVYYRAESLKAKLMQLFGDEDTTMRMIYNLSEVYDLWYSDFQNSEEGNVQ